MRPLPSHSVPSEGAGLRRLATGMATLAVLAACVLFAQNSRGYQNPVAEAATKANAFLETLEAPQKAKVLLAFDSPQKPSWSNLPVTFVPRNGLSLGEMNPKQKEAALATLAAVLSKEGYQKAIDIMNGDDKLIKGNNPNKFGTDHYFLAIFGKPSPNEPWMVQFGGHHLGINVTIKGTDSVVTPTHTGTQPDVVERDGKSVRPLGQENDLAFEPVNALDAEQKQKAVKGDRPKNLLMGPGKEYTSLPTEVEGIKGSDLKEPQREILVKLIGAWMGILPGDAANKRMAEVKAQIQDTHFVWYGPTKNGGAAYFRIQGPDLWIEYAPQGSTSHIHTIIRAPGKDYGKEWRKE